MSVCSDNGQNVVLENYDAVYCLLFIVTMTPVLFAFVLVIC